MKKIIHLKKFDRYDFAKYALEKTLVGAKKEIVFDVGALDARLKNSLSNFNIEYKAFDLYPSKGVYQWNLEEKLDAKFGKADIVILLDVLEHLFNPEICLNNIKNILKSSGYLILSVPNPNYSIGRIKFLFTSKLHKFKKKDLNDNHHVFVTFAHIVEKLLDDLGFEVIQFAIISKVPNDIKKMYFHTRLKEFFNELPRGRAPRYQKRVSCPSYIFS